MRAPLSVLLLLSLLGSGCDGKDPSSPGAGGDDGSDDTADAVDSREGPAYSGAQCPSLVAGRNTGFASGDTERELEILLPADPAGAPVVFAWHWLGGNASQAVRYMDLQSIADGGAIVVAPESDGAAYEWHFLEGPTGNPDLLLFDDLLSCLWTQYDVDLERIYATGMSAGGLWTSYLTLHRADWLAATAPLSGGSDAGSYTTPAAPIPVLLTWGGPSDTYSGYSFDSATQFLSGALQDDGHTVIECEHTLGHTIPPGSTDYIWRFFQDHPRGVTSPYLDAGLPDVFPTWCAMP